MARALAALLIATGAAMVVPAEAQEGYLTPPQEVVDILDAPGLSDLSAAPDGGWIALLERPPMLSLTEIAQPRLHLAGYRLNPRNNGPSAGGRPDVSGIEFIHLTDGRRVPVALGDGVATAHHQWSPDGSALAYSVVGRDGYELWLVGAGETTPRRLTAERLNAAHGNPCSWTGDSSELLCRFVPADRGAPPPQPEVATTPRIQEALGEPAPVRTFQDLLQDHHDADLFEHYYTSQLAYIDASSGSSTPVGAPAIVDRFDPSPSGEFVYVVRTVRPFSFIVPDRWRTNDWFPREMEIWDRNGRMIRSVASLPLEEDVAVDDFRSGPRGVMWEPGSGAALLWVEDVEGRVAGVRDQLVRLPEPSGEEVVLLSLADRFAEMAWTADGRGLVTEVDRFPRRAASWTRSWLVSGTSAFEPRTVVDRSAEERYGAPGSPVTTGRTLVASGDWIFLRGDGASPEGEQPFLDRFNLSTLETERVWESAADRYETPVVLVADGIDELIIRGESPVDPPNYFHLDRRSGSVTALTDFQDPSPQIRGAGRQVLTYEREDGVRLAGVMYTPPDWDGTTRLPTVLWAYPREFVSPDAAAQVPGATNRFTRLSGASHMFLLLGGYAIFDGPSIAILGGLTANDTYIEQLVSSTQAAIDAAVEAGISDRDRFGVGGHSYGGFMTANLLAHSDMFRAGIARSAAHNRTLTPFGFQNERRTIWEAPDVYLGMSPFMYAHQIDAPMLILHGVDDANPGTFPVQSERMFHALKGQGKVSRLVMLTHEDHGYAARESVLHTIAEMVEWFDRYVKEPADR